MERLLETGKEAKWDELGLACEDLKKRKTEWGREIDLPSLLSLSLKRSILFHCCFFLFQRPQGHVPPAPLGPLHAANQRRKTPGPDSRVQAGNGKYTHARTRYASTRESGMQNSKMRRNGGIDHWILSRRLF